MEMIVSVWKEEVLVVMMVVWFASCGRLDVDGGCAGCLVVKTTDALLGVGGASWQQKQEHS